MWQDCNTNSLDMIFKSQFSNLNAAVRSSSMPAFKVKDSGGGGGAGGHGDKTKGVAADQVQGAGAAHGSNLYTSKLGRNATAHEHDDPPTECKALQT